MSTPEASLIAGAPTFHYLNRERPCILLFRGRGLISTAIRWQTRSQYSHAALLFPGGKSLVEAWQFHGVQERDISDWQGIDRFAVPSATADQWRTVLEFAQQQVGKSYDYRGVFRFLSRTPASTDDAWFCSELVFAAFEHAGIKLLHETSANAVSPAMLALSPLTFKATLPRL